MSQQVPLTTSSDFNAMVSNIDPEIHFAFGKNSTNLVILSASKEKLEELGKKLFGNMKEKAILSSQNEEKHIFSIIIQVNEYNEVFNFLKRNGHI